MIETTRLANGLKVVLQENRAAPVVAFQAWVGVGSGDEPDELAGIAHVFEHMLFKGTARRSVGQIAHEVEAAGGEINAWTSLDETVYHLVLASRDFDTGLDILTDALRFPSFDAAELERELKVILEEVKQGEDTPSRMAMQALFATTYSRHPYRRPVIGTVSTVEKLTRAQLVDFFRRHYTPDNITLVVVGDFDREEAKRKIAALWEDAAPGTPPPRQAVTEPPQQAPHVRVLGGDTPEAHVGIAFHIPGIVSADTGALDVGAIILGQGDSSRLHREVKRNRQLVQEIYAYSFAPRDAGLLVVGATLPADRLEETLDAMLDEILRVAREEVSLDELEKARAIVESDAVYQKETVQGQARKLGFFQSVAGTLDFEEQYHRQVRELTPSGLRESLAKYLRIENLSLAVLLPAGAASASREIETRLLARIEAARARADERRPSTPPTRDPVVREVLPSGTTVLIYRDPSVPLVAVRAAWAGGLLAENDRTNGINNLLAMLITQGTKTRSADALAREIESMAGSVGGFSGRNSFGIRAELLARHWERGLEILLDCLFNPRFDEAELEKERRHVIEELRTQEDNPASVVFRLFAETLYPHHPYRYDLLGTNESVAALTQRRLSDYYQRHFPISQMTLSIVGDVDAAHVLERLRTLLGRAPRAEARVDSGGRTRRQAGEFAATPRRAVRELQKQQAHFVIGFPGLTLRDPDRYVLEVLATVLSGQGGRLFTELRDKRGLAYRVNAFSLEGVDPGYFAVYVATSPSSMEAAEAAIRDELAKLVDHPIAASELQRAQRYLVGAHDISLQRRSALAAALAFDECYGLGWDDYRRYAANILAVTVEDVQRAAKKYLDPGREVVALVRPPQPETAAAAAQPAGPAKARAARGLARGKSHGKAKQGAKRHKSHRPPQRRR